MFYLNSSYVKKKKKKWMPKKIKFYIGIQIWLIVFQSTGLLAFL